jgi:serine/threonine-protein kinase
LVDVRSDIWALGVVLYELLVGRTVFPAETMPELIAAILACTHDPIRTFRTDVDPALDAAVARCLEKDAARRFANVAEFANAIAPFGPPRSEQSVERISHVLGVDARGAGAATASVTPRQVVVAAGATSTDPRKDTAATNAPLSRSLEAGAGSLSQGSWPVSRR